MSLSVSAILPALPVNSTGMRTLKSPFFIAVSVRNNIRSKSFGEISVALSIPMPVVMTRSSSETANSIVLKRGQAGTRRDSGAAQSRLRRKCRIQTMDEGGTRQEVRGLAAGRSRTQDREIDQQLRGNFAGHELIANHAERPGIRLRRLRIEEIGDVVAK